MNNYQIDDKIFNDDGLAVESYLQYEDDKFLAGLYCEMNGNGYQPGGNGTDIFPEDNENIFGENMLQFLDLGGNGIVTPEEINVKM